MKYVMMEVKQRKQTGFILNIPFLFPEMVTHIYISTVAKLVCEEHWPDSDIKCISAGFCSSMDVNVDCYGESETLKLKSREDIDSNIIKMADYGGCNV